MKRKITIFLITLLALSVSVAIAKNYARHSATGAAAISETVTFSGDSELIEMRAHLSAAGAAGNLTVTLDSAMGAAYDIVLLTQDMTSVVDLIWRPERISFRKDDKIVIAWANSGTKTYGLEIIWED